MTIQGVADANSHIQLFNGANAVGTANTGADGTWSLTMSSAVPNSVQTFKAQEIGSAGNVIASSGSAILGSTHSDTLTSTSANDFFVGNGSADTFVFAANFGKDVIADFRSGGPTHDVVQFSASTFDSFASVLAHAAQSGQDVVISADPSNSLTLKHTKLSDLHQSDFHFA